MQKNKTMSNLTKKYYNKIFTLKDYRNIIESLSPELAKQEVNLELYKFAKLINGGIKYEEI